MDGTPPPHILAGTGPIEEKLAAIRRETLSGATLAAPDLSFLRPFQFHAVRGRLARESAGGGPPAFGTRGAGLFAGLHATESPWVLCADHRPPFTFLSCGSPARSGGSIAPHLSADVGRQHVEEATSGEAIVTGLAGLAATFALTGIPPVLPGERPSAVEALAGGLTGLRWALLVIGFPLRGEVALNAMSDLARELRLTDETYLTPGTLKEKDRLALRYRELLEGHHGRFALAQSSGLWQAGAYVFGESQETARRGAALLVAALLGDRGLVPGAPDAALPVPLRTHRCEPSGQHVDARVNVLTSPELAELCALPVRTIPGFRVDRDPGLRVERRARDPADISIGHLVHEGATTAEAFALPTAALTRHALVCGTTGSGKTRTCQRLLHEAWMSPATLGRGRRVPFLVIEPAKAEYRTLLRVPGLESLAVYTAGDETPGRSAPLRFNPFWFPPSVPVQTHIDLLKAAFNASFVLYAPMPYLLELALHEAYERKGWDLASSENHRGRGPAAYPTLSGLAAVVDDVSSRAGYSDRVGADVRAGLRTRLATLCAGAKGGMFDVPGASTLGALFDRPTVVELQALGSAEDRVFVMALLLQGLYEHCLATRPRSATQLEHVTLIEEAHRLLRASSEEVNPEAGANPRGLAVETFSNLLAELRSYGEGFVIAEQVPTKLARDVVKNTATKIMHRLVATDDRATVGAAMTLEGDQDREAALLSPGEAIVFTEGMHGAARARVDALAPARSVDDVELFGLQARRIPEASMDPFAPWWATGLPGIPSTVAGHFRGARRFLSPDLDESIDVYVSTVLAAGDGAGPARGVGAALRALLPPRAPAEARTATLLATLDRAFDERATAYSLPFAVAGELARACFTSMDEAGGAAAFADAYRQAMRLPDGGPLAGCEACRSACLHRFEVRRLAEVLGLSRTVSEVLTGHRADTSFAPIAEEALRCSRRLVPPGGAPDVALCWTVHEVHGRRLRHDLQAAVVRGVASYLWR
ncbi:MAG: DUF87 domain-containing protein [Deltaproteobacteria bacterium]|nr:DUF87 domain-containing protein [Deltaproteobacteria bacterium]